MKTAIFHGLLVFAVLSVACDGSDAPAVPATEVDEPNRSTLPSSSTPTPGAFETDDRISCTDEVKADRKRHVQVLREVKDRHPEVLEIPGVNGYGAGSIFRDGERTDELGIIITVDSEFPPEEVDPDDLIPSHLEGCVVSVERAHYEPA